MRKKPVFNRFHVRLLVDRFADCFRFYRDMLQLPVRYGTPADTYGEFKGQGVHIALFRKDLMADAVGTAHRPAHADCQDASVLVLRVDNVDAMIEAVVARGARIIAKPRDRPLWGCRTAYLRDPDGNLIEINSDLGDRP
jgi:catechol 2,3-dioxygenase-like lactoylglutathione lyase family enzyme